MKTYSELVKIPTFLERYRYLQINGIVGNSTFGFDRWLNQKFYSSPEWRRFRRDIIIRDNGCDLGCEDHPIGKTAYIHHMNPIIPDDLIKRTDIVMNPEYVITVSFDTHQAIHFGDENLLPADPIVRRPYDTCPWKV